MQHTAPSTPTASPGHPSLEHLGAWLLAEQREAQRNLAQCLAVGSAADANYWARRHAQLAIAANAVHWFTEATTL